jgi:hypothetical protein
LEIMPLHFQIFNLKTLLRGKRHGLAMPIFAPTSISRGTLDGHGHGSPSPLSAVFPVSLVLATPSSYPHSFVTDSASASVSARAASYDPAEGAQRQGAGAQDDPHAAPSSYIAHSAFGGIGAVLLLALKAGMPVREGGRDVRLLGGGVFEWGEWGFYFVCFYSSVLAFFFGVFF